MSDDGKLEFRVNYPNCSVNGSTMEVVGSDNFNKLPFIIFFICLLVRFFFT